MPRTVVLEQLSCSRGSLASTLTVRTARYCLMCFAQRPSATSVERAKSPRPLAIAVRQLRQGVFVAACYNGVTTAQTLLH